jgi:hypothetical protein
VSTGFPLLREEPLFLASLIDLFRDKGLVSVVIGVREENSLSTDMYFALESSADYRLYLSHYPTPYDLAGEILGRRAVGIKRAAPVLSEQRVNVVLDNVTGKHYGREPRWLHVEESPRAQKRHKILHCLDSDKLPLHTKR